MRLVRAGITVGLSWCVAISAASAQGSSQVEPLAVVNGKTITAADVDTKLGAALAKLQEQIYTLKHVQLDTLTLARGLDIFPV